MELLPIGPVLFIDTAGIDDVGALGELRARRTMQIFDRTDVGLIVAEGDQWGEFEDGLLAELTQRIVPVIVVFNKTDLAPPDPFVVVAAGRCPFPASALVALAVLIEGSATGPADGHPARDVKEITS